ncbi:class I lanthipeptide [Hymenobacter algoricola]|uniref:Natural product n=1 Tax=Hymenobacter algoricola TaxID=486267 RepID=A0ABP7NRZ4_9BACT
MKKQDVFATKLSFNKEKVASLTPDDLDQVHGGDGQTGSSQSSYNNFTCCACTTLNSGSHQVEEAN